MARFRLLAPGDPAPWFHQRSAKNPRFAFDTVAGRYIVLCFLGTASDPRSQAALEAAFARPDVFDDVHACFFALSLDTEDETQARLAERYPGYRVFWDFDGSVSRLFGALAEDDGATARPLWVVLDPALRVLRVCPIAESPPGELIAWVAALPPPDRHIGADLFPPILHLPNVLEPDLCLRLIDLYEAQGGTESGFMCEQDGRTTLVVDATHKRRRDCSIEDGALISQLQTCVRRRIVPEIAKAFQFHVTRMERYIVACYAAEDEGHFRAHRDNTTKGTAHRRFAVSVNLNADFEGGELSFPEFGARGFKPAPGAAIVFSCSLLHAASKITAGKRFAFLPFLYDDAAAEIRERNNAYLGEGLGEYNKQ